MTDNHNIKELKNYLEKRINDELFAEINGHYIVNIEKNFCSDKFWHIDVCPVIRNEDNIELGHDVLEEILDENGMLENNDRNFDHFTFEKLNNYANLLKLKGEM